MAAFVRNVRYAFRLFLKTPGFTLVAIVCLGLGIGVNASVFSLLDFAVYKPLAVTDPARLFVLSQGYRAFFSVPEFRSLRERSHSVELATFMPTESSLEYERNTHLISAEAVSANYGQVTQSGTALGRWFTSDIVLEAVISYSAWQRSLHSDPSIIGKLIRAESRWYTVVGIARRGFSGTNLPLQTDLWVPFHAWAQQYPQIAADLENPTKRRVMILARLRQSATLGQARAELKAANIGATVKEAPLDLKPLAGFADRDSRRSSLRVLTLLMTVTAVVLLIACLNVGNLLLARSATRTPEISMRVALGASRPVVVSQLMTENLLLAFGGVLAGLAVRYAADRILIAVLPELAPTEPLFLDLSLDHRMFFFAAVALFISVLVFGLAPAWKLGKTDVLANLAPASTIGGIGLRRTTQILQVCVSLVLLVVAGLFLRSLFALESVNPGFATKNRIFATTYISPPEFNRQTGRQFYAELIARLKRAPDVENAGLTYLLPLTANRPDCVSTSTNHSIPAFTGTADPNFLGVMNIGLLSGRAFNAFDGPNAPPVVIVNEKLATRLLPAQPAVGKRILVGCENPQAFEIAGVMKDFAVRSLNEAQQNMIYYPAAQQYRGLANIVVQTRAASPDAIGAVRRILLDSSANLRIFQMGNMQEQVERSFWQTKWEASLIGIFALLALSLAAVGLYGVIAYNVTARTREIAIRVAVGAGRADVLGLVVRQTIVLTGIGIVLGIAASLAFSKLLAGFLFGIGRTDFLTYGASALLWIIVSLFACLLPAKHATAIEPAVALRNE